MEAWQSWRQPRKSPMVVNLFQQLLGHTGELELVPIFPYLGAGDLVVCASRLMGGPELEEFTFIHNNVVPETVLVVAEEGGAIPTGSVLALLGEHAVASSFLANPSDASSYIHFLIAVRMNFESTQHEEIVIHCPHCDTEVFRERFNVKEGPSRPVVPEFRGLYYYDQAVQHFNAGPRWCSSCQRTLPPFPRQQMGWGRYAQNVEIANRGFQRLMALVARPEEVATE